MQYQPSIASRLKMSIFPGLQILKRKLNLEKKKEKKKKFNQAIYEIKIKKSVKNVESED